MLGTNRFIFGGRLVCSLMLTVQLVGCATPTMNVIPTPIPSPTALPLPVEVGNIQIGVAQEFILPGRTPILLEWHLEESITAEIFVEATSGNEQGGILDPIIEVLDEDYNRVVYADDGGETTTDAYISSRQWDVGHYQIRLNTFDGYWSGTVKILIQPSELE